MPTAVLNIEELATIFHFPLGSRFDHRTREGRIAEGESAGFAARYRRRNHNTMPHDTSKEITPLGFHNYRGNREQKFGIKLDDRRRHVYVVGKTGVGKSTLLENMAVADIQSGKGIAFIDPHGESAEKLLDFIPEEAARRCDLL